MLIESFFDLVNKHKGKEVNIHYKNGTKDTGKLVLDKSSDGQDIDITVNGGTYPKTLYRKTYDTCLGETEITVRRYLQITKIIPRKTKKEK
jgi:hypothetical protein